MLRLNKAHVPFNPASDPAALLKSWCKVFTTSLEALDFEIICCPIMRSIVSQHVGIQIYLYDVSPVRQMMVPNVEARSD